MELIQIQESKISVLDSGINKNLICSLVVMVANFLYTDKAAVRFCQGVLNHTEKITGLSPVLVIKNSVTLYQRKFNSCTGNLKIMINIIKESYILLRQLEWSNDYATKYHCPVCDEDKSTGHKPSCKISLYLIMYDNLMGDIYCESFPEISDEDLKDKPETEETDK